MALWQFISKTCMDNDIDESHGLKHAQDCVMMTLSLQENMTMDEIVIAIYSAALHDMCDKKYMDVSIGVENIKTWLLTQPITPEQIQIIVDIITSMSYSKLKSQMINGCPVFPDHGIYNTVYHTVRHADLLDAYKVHRCFMYQKHLHSTMSDEDCWVHVRNVFEERIFRYVSDGWITLPQAIAQVPALTEKALCCFNSKTFS